MLPAHTRAPIARVRFGSLILSAGTPDTMMPTISSKLPVLELHPCLAVECWRIRTPDTTNAVTVFAAAVVKQRIA